ncbi:MAG: DUF4398 domain-containing protein [Candidatus Calescibacterium sp.]|nr:DUF4398 domain-containing protein [Candidatus Calescibacterium sp.]MCX7733399.1 DUF4398 domain-containing protein [bacterium]MDW8087459.1 DUF4398 domain-containing protein [Candidatus Calescibacterium sp.]
MKKGIIYNSLVLALFGLVFSYCEKKPEKELQDAQGAVKELEEMGAPQYIPDEWQALKSKLEDAQAKVDRRQYKEARELLSSIISLAPTLKQKIEEKKKEEEAAKAQEQQQAAPEAATPPSPAQPQ